MPNPYTKNYVPPFKPMHVQRITPPINPINLSQNISNINQNVQDNMSNLNPHNNYSEFRPHWNNGSQTTAYNYNQYFKPVDSPLVSTVRYIYNNQNSKF